MSFSSRLREAMEARGLKASDLSRSTGIGKNSISDYINGKYEAKQQNIYKIALALNVNEAWLMGMDVYSKRTTREFEMIPAKIVETESEPLYAPLINVAAGAFHADMSQLDEVIEIPYKYRHLHKQLFAVRVNGDSMNKILPNGYITLCEDITQTGYSPKNGDLVVFEHDGEYTIKKYVDTSSMVILDPCSYDERFKPMVYDKSDDLNIKLLGVVKKSFMEFE